MTDDGSPGSQALKAQLRLRELVLAGELPPGERIAELAIVEKLGMSRTPIRSALMRLEQEGLLEALPGGGYAVRSFSERDVADAIELRGTIEGLAARLAAERGAPMPGGDRRGAAAAGAGRRSRRGKQTAAAPRGRAPARSRRCRPAPAAGCGSAR